MIHDHTKYNSLEFERWSSRAVLIGSVAAIICVVLAVFVPGGFFRGYLAAYEYWLGLSIGSLVLLMIQYLSGGEWGSLLRRIFEAAATCMIPLAVCWIPVLLGLSFIYPWTNDAVQESLKDKANYLNVPFFVVRAVLFFAIWVGLAIVLTRWSRKTEGTPAENYRPFRLLSGPGLFLMGVAVTFSSIDWLMSLEPHWYSSIFGLLVGTGQILGSMAFAVAVILRCRPMVKERDVLNAPILRDLGNLLLAFVMLWAYMAFSQYLIIWSGNLQEETPYYLRRSSTFWKGVALALICVHFFVPFLLLLSRKMKDHPARLLRIAGLILAMRFLDEAWLVIPTSEEHQGVAIVSMICSFLAIGSGWIWFFVRSVTSRNLLPIEITDSSTHSAIDAHSVVDDIARTEAIGGPVKHELMEHTRG